MQRIFAPPFEGSSLLKEAQKEVVEIITEKFWFHENKPTFASALKNNEAFKEASLLVDFYKRSLTWCSSPESSSEDSFKNPLSPRKVVSHPSTDEMLDSLRFSTD